MARENVRILGRFPPPFDGQAIATKTLGNVLESAGVAVKRVNLSAPEADVRENVSALSRIRHYAGLRSHVREAHLYGSSGPSLWTSISPRLLGHFRDWGTIVSAVGTQPLLAIVHHGDFHALFERFATKAAAKLLVDRLAGIVFLSSGLAEACAPWVPADKCFVIPNTLDSDIHLPQREWLDDRPKRVDGKPFQLLYLSGMIAAKGYLHVLDAVGQLKQRGIPVCATFAGRWESAADQVGFQNRARDLCVSDDIKHLGSVTDRAVVSALFRGTDAFVMPTTYRTEAQPLTIIEALNAGAPVIATAHASIPEMIEDGRSGILVEKNSPASIADAVERLLPADVWGTYSSAARARYESVFAPDVVRAQWLDLLARI